MKKSEGNQNNGKMKILNAIVLFIGIFIGTKINFAINMDKLSPNIKFIISFAIIFTSICIVNFIISKVYKSSNGKKIV